VISRLLIVVRVISGVDGAETRDCEERGTDAMSESFHFFSSPREWISLHRLLGRAAAKEVSAFWFGTIASHWYGGISSARHCVDAKQSSRAGIANYQFFR
jgi:hypothetical protein